MSRAATDAELALARRLAPQLSWQGARVEEGGQFHRVLLGNEQAVIRMARTPQASAAMPRSVALHRAVSERLAWQVPTALSPIATDAQGLAAVAMRYIPGTAHPPHRGDARILRRVVDALAEVELDTLRPLLAEPFAFGGPWTTERRQASHDALPLELRPAALTLWEQLPELAQVPPGLVHGDLAGHNMHWVDGELIGILDWDLAAAWDPALNTAYLCLWHGQDLIDQVAPDPGQARRARIWLGLMSLERFSDAIARIDHPRLDKLLRKIGPRLRMAAAAAARG